MGIELRNGDFVGVREADEDEASIEASEGRVWLRPRYGREFSVPYGEVRVIYLKPLREKGTLRYGSEDEPYRARLLLTNGDSLGGLLMEMSGAVISFKPPYCEVIELAADDIVYMDFPHHYKLTVTERLSEAGARDEITVGLIGDASDVRAGMGKVVGKDTLYYNVSRILYELGVESKWLNAEQLASREILNAEHFSLLINVDENEHYYDTYSATNDGYRAIRDYVRGGGDFAHLARGTPFYYAYRPQGGRWATFTSGNELNRELGLNIASPGETKEGSEGFELPENLNRRLSFKLVGESGYLGGLPKEVEFPMVRDCRFRPIYDGETLPGAEFVPVYMLKDSSGKSYGYAMAVIRYSAGEHYALYASHLLLDASYEGVSMLEYIVPYLLELTHVEKR
jgi:hypothetical protein